MYMTKMARKIIFTFCFSFFLAFGLFTQQVYAASTIMGVTPQSGSFSGPFTVSLQIDGHGDSFNGAQATVTVSSSLAIQDLSLGNCNFSFTKTPSSSDPSFQGIILGGSQKKCQVYSMTVVPVSRGTAMISLTSGTVKRYGDAADILSATQNGTYTLTAVSTAPAASTQIIPQPKGNLYSVALNVMLTDHTPVKNATVIFTSVTAKTSIKVTTDASGRAMFPNIQSGVYTATVANYEGQTVLNVNGNNHVLVLGMQVQVKQVNMTLVLAGIIIVLLIVLGVGILFFYRHQTKR